MVWWPQNTGIVNISNEGRAFNMNVVVVHEPEGQLVPLEAHCIFWEGIHPNNMKMYDSSALRIASKTKKRYSFL